MLKIERTTPKHSGDARASWVRTCDTCCSTASAVYCRADLAYLCISCDARIHQAAPFHDRVWLCESCERAPAAFLCKADSASLCATCDSEIHSANPLARRHHRVPIQPITGPLATNPIGVITRPLENEDDEVKEDKDEAASWLLLNPMKNCSGDQSGDENGPPLYGGEVDEYLDLDHYSSCPNNQFNEEYGNQGQQYSVAQRSYGGDSVVPIQLQKVKNQVQHHCFHLGLEGGHGYTAPMSQSVSISSMDVGVVPEATSEVSISHARAPKGSIDLFSSSSIQLPTQLSPMDREARVLRYREKKKNRKFDKTIRYASRKAYAETRPRDQRQVREEKRRRS